MASKPIALEENVLVSKNDIDIYLPKNLNVLAITKQVTSYTLVRIYTPKLKNIHFDKQSLDNRFLNKTIDIKHKTYKITKWSSTLTDYVITDPGIPSVKRSISVYRITLEIKPTTASPAVKAFKEEKNKRLAAKNERNKRINEELLVFADHLEDLGFLDVATKIRKMQRKTRKLVD
jgi:hypothetical protein